MTAHITLPSKNIVNLFVGTAADAQKDGAKLLDPTTDTVEYSDGTSEEVYGFDVPVPAVDEDFDLALIGTKGNGTTTKYLFLILKKKLADGSYEAEVTLGGGTGRATVDSPAKVVIKDGKLRQPLCGAVQTMITC